MKQIIPSFYVWNIVELAQAKHAEEQAANCNRYFARMQPRYIFILNVNIAPTTFDEDYAKFLDTCSCNNISPKKYSMVIRSDANSWIRIVKKCDDHPCKKSHKIPRSQLPTKQDIDQIKKGF